MSGEHLTPREALDLIRGAVARLPERPEGRLERDDFDNAVWVVRRDLSHLDADAMNDRLHAWVRREVEAVIPHATAGVRWDHAHPESPHEPADLEYEAVWLDVEPAFRMELEMGDVTATHAEEWVAHLGRFLEVVGAEGRPEGWRDLEMGNAE